MTINIRDYEIKTYSDLVPNFNYKIYEANISNDFDFVYLKDYCLKLEQEIISKYPSGLDGNTKLGDKSLTSRYTFYSLFCFDEMKPLAEIVRKHYDAYIFSLGKDKNHNTYCQSWVNVLRNGEKMATHNHWAYNYTYLSAHICVAANETNTNYYNPLSGERYSSSNIPGKLTIFPSWIFHDTSMVIDSDPRITIAMDFYTEQGFKEDIFAR